MTLFKISLFAHFQDEVRTLAGGDLFEFGDADGLGDEVRLQHPLGVVFHEGRVLIADTYNHKIKQLDPATRAVRTFAGTGQPGQTDGPNPSFYEPAGLSVAGATLRRRHNTTPSRCRRPRHEEDGTSGFEGSSRPRRGTASAPEGERRVFGPERAGTSRAAARRAGRSGLT